MAIWSAADGIEGVKQSLSRLNEDHMAPHYSKYTGARTAPYVQILNACVSPSDLQNSPSCGGIPVQPLIERCALPPTKRGYSTKNQKKSASPFPTSCSSNRLLPLFQLLEEEAPPSPSSSRAVVAAWVCFRRILVSIKSRSCCSGTLALSTALVGSRPLPPPAAIGGGGGMLFDPPDDTAAVEVLAAGSLSLHSPSDELFGEEDGEDDEGSTGEPTAALLFFLLLDPIPSRLSSPLLLRFLPDELSRCFLLCLCLRLWVVLLLSSSSLPSPPSPRRLDFLLFLSRFSFLAC